MIYVTSDHQAAEAYSNYNNIQRFSTELSTSNSAFGKNTNSLLYLPVLKCVWRLGPGSPIVRWAERWPCPSCTHHRWYYIDTGVLAQQWIHRSLTWTSSIGALLWLKGSHRCPTWAAEGTTSVNALTKAELFCLFSNFTGKWPLKICLQVLFTWDK